jgi:inner membrane protease subunit 2
MAAAAPSWLRSLGASALAGATATPLVIAFTDGVATLATCEGASMRPTLNPRDGDSTVVLLDKWSMRTGRVARGDVVVVSSPTRDGAMVLKRVLALGGDYVRRAHGRGEPILVPKGHCWIEGDNTAASHDSNSFGPIPIGLVQARVLAKVWPLGEAGALARIESPPSRVWRPGRDFAELQRGPS